MTLLAALVIVLALAQWAAAVVVFREQRRQQGILRRVRDDLLADRDMYRDKCRLYERQLDETREARRKERDLMADIEKMLDQSVANMYDAAREAREAQICEDRPVGFPDPEAAGE